VAQEEVDREVTRIAQQNRESVPATKRKLSEDGTMDRLASHIQTEKTLNFLFDKSVKTVPEPEPEPAAETPSEAANETDNAPE